MNFSQGKKPLTVNQLAHAVELPLPLAQQLLTALVESKLVSGTPVKETAEFAYQPAKAIDLLTVKFVIDTLEQKGENDIHLAQTDEIAALSNILEQFDEIVEQNPANLLLKDIPTNKSPYEHQTPLSLKRT